jgi:pseudouridine kinase
MKLTAREKEIVEALHKEPLISQDELALQFGISRSSVAVHISNLMKKGIILGKGYVFNQKVSIVVVGQVGLEIRVQEEDGATSIDMQQSGFGLQMCRTLAEFGVNPKLITVVGNDELGNSILNDLQAMDADITNIFRNSSQRTCKRIISNRGLNLAEGCSPHEFRQAIEAREWVVSNCDWLLVEPVFQDFVADKIGARHGSLPCLAGNWYLQGAMPIGLKRCGLVILGVEDFHNYERHVNQGLELLEAGTKNCVLTDGSSNMVVVNAEGVRDYPLLPNQIFDSRTDLDVFMAGLVYGLSARYPLRQALRIASGAAHSGRANGTG